jgi:phage I-like protein
MTEHPTLTPLFNRSADGSFKLPEDGWFHLVPKGVFPIVDPENPKAVLKQVVDDQALERMLNRFSEDATVPNFPGLLVDFDHFSYDSDKSSEAAGWVVKLENRSNGLWGQVKWTPKGEQAVKDGAYRFISPVWGKREAEKLTNSNFRPARLESLGLTNQPNLRGMVPLSNRCYPQGAKPEALSGAPGASANEQNKMKKVAEYLGLSPDAAEDAVLAEVTKLKNRNTTLETENGTLKNRNTELSASQVELALDKYKNRFKPEKRDAWKNRLTEDYAGALEILEEMPEAGPAKAGNQTSANGGGKMLNRKDASTPEDKEGKPTDNKARAAKIETLASDYKLKNRCTLGEAYDAVERLHPELFQEATTEA